MKKLYALSAFASYNNACILCKMNSQSADWNVQWNSYGLPIEWLSAGINNSNATYSGIYVYNRSFVTENTTDNIGVFNAADHHICRHNSHNASAELSVQQPEHYTVKIGDCAERVLVKQNLFIIKTDKDYEQT